MQQFKILPEYKLTEMNTIAEEDFSVEFCSFMRDAVVQPRYRYGRPEENYGREIVPVSAIANARARMEKYEETGNINYPVDAANFLMYEFKFSKHPHKHYDCKSGHPDLYIGLSHKQMLEFENKEV